MSGWKALNLESDSESDIDIDDTKELQIEDALKLYQIAVQYHAEGPASYEKAAKAYRELFESEIFRYPESQTELQRIDLYGPQTDGNPFEHVSLQTGQLVANGGLDAGSSTLPQILHLSHKNYAQFRLEYLTVRLDTLHVTLREILGEASAALDHFVQALDKDDSDLDLWRKTATVGSILDSKRVARFCLEAVLEGDDEGLTGVLSLPGLEEGMVIEQLQALIVQLDDVLSLVQTPLTKRKRKGLAKALRHRLSVFTEITRFETTLLQHEQMPGKGVGQPQRIVLKAPTTWAEVGDALLKQLMAEQHGTSINAPAPAIAFDTSNDIPYRIHATPEAMQIDIVTRADVEPMSWPTSISEQFPGLDAGRPTVQPQIAAADASMHVRGKMFINTHGAPTASPEMTVATRKRSADASGLQDGPEDARTKTRRTRARESNATEPIDSRPSKQAQLEANQQWEYDQQINEFQAADEWMFETVSNLFERIGVVGFEKAKEVRQELCSVTEAASTSDDNESVSDAFPAAKADILSFLNTFSEQMAYVLLQKGEDFDVGSLGGAIGMGPSFGNTSTSKSVNRTIPLPNDGLVRFLVSVDSGWCSLQDIAYDWLLHLLQPNHMGNVQANTYTDYTWPGDLKTNVVRTLVNFDDSIYESLRTNLERTTGASSMHDDEIHSTAVTVQTIFELHLDIYTLIKQPDSGVATDTVEAQAHRLGRWSDIAREAMYFRANSSARNDHRDELFLRFLWTAAFAVAADATIPENHVIQCLHDLRAEFVCAGEPIILLQNNAVMSELSVTALDQELSKLTTKDFFLKVTSQDASDPVAVIEGLEPLLLALEGQPASELEDEADTAALARVSPDLISFLQNSKLAVRLMLWLRLRDAYEKIEHIPMVVSCYFHIMALVLRELGSQTTVELPQRERQTMVLRILRMLNSMVSKTAGFILASDDALECIDDAALRSAITTLGGTLQLLQVFNVFEDSLRVGQSQPPTMANGQPIPAFATATDMVHEMQINIWMILYALLREAIYQNSDLYPALEVDKFDFLRCVHRNLGIRGFCGGANKMFVRMLKDEFVHMKHVEGYESEQAQVFYDLYGLNCFLDPSYELIEHHCQRDAYPLLERGVAWHAVDLCLIQAAKLSIRDLIKHPLKDAFERVHAVVPRKKPSDAIMRNREVYRTFIRSPINPVDLYNCLRGAGNVLSVSPCPRSDAPLADRGWYFLMGYMALTKFRSQKRTTPVPTDDVDIAIALFMQELEYSTESWETWLRLAQAYDTKIEESVVWSAEKLNNNMPEIVQLQRAAIHCYTMATALLHRSSDDAPETLDKATELYTEFAFRLYSSSREPFSMLPFAVDDAEKFLSHPTGLDKGKPFAPLRVYMAWKLAKTFINRAIAHRPQSWTLRYMLGKILWKMHTAPDHVRLHNEAPTAQQVLEPFVRAIELLPDKKDSRERREPTLEPHYKLVSLVHKLVSRGELSLEQAREALQHTPYARLVTFPQEFGAWQAHVLAIIKNLRTADKSNWHHRIIARTAHIVYEAAGPVINGRVSDEVTGAAAAKHELMQQMFTKTMVLQVWRPECERAGRHFVYTTRYTRFFVKVLEELKDRQSLDALARRVRRRPHDMFEHSTVWQEICNAYLRLLRNYAQLSEGLETSTFSNIAHEDFLARKEPLEQWMQAQDQGNSPALDVLREVQELKKVNQSLMKPGPIDDLIGDSYAYLFGTVGKQLSDDERRIKQEEEEAVRPKPVASPLRNPMMSLNHLMNLDGVTEPVVAATAPAVPTPAVPADSAPQRKKIGVGRREIPGTRVQVVIDNNRSAAGDASFDNSMPGSVHDSADDESELSELEEDGDDEGSVQGEEVDGGGSPRPMFPGLAPSPAEQEPQGIPADKTSNTQGDTVMADVPDFVTKRRGSAQ
ncbi:hypothetical protein BAUCODRAFT_125974 [Baudoinia panamericana UAMH 10762]|uniref:Histone transcription regulator 3 homolog n=1 Tax=Baudoinia panamericana (strain UAMH 10762) TaxID=717646 RepID=M2MNL7_BAUPA|nr:uncharacterized protein BAUCODRAFT_125974 [Baudoinia panamericana UAMH 10762]EMC93043.1 hypothetical protein BAUCODRAFT_125974 [Baudoinia panamericana UAMH 10762]